MDKEWAKLGGHFLGKDEVRISSAVWEAARFCKSLAIEAGLGEEKAQAFEEAAESLELCMHGDGEKANSLPFFAKTHSDYSSHSNQQEFLAVMIRDFVFKKIDTEERREVWQRCGWSAQYADVKNECDKLLNILPTSWFGGNQNASVWTIEYAKKTQAIMKKQETALPAGKSLDLIRVSHELGEAGRKWAQLGEACKELKKARKRMGWGEVETVALAVVEKTTAELGKKRGFVDNPKDVVVVGEDGRFSPQKAYAGFLPQSKKGAEGFWGSTNQSGMDLGAAKLFESPERAKQYFERGGFSQCQIVEVEIRVSAAVLNDGVALPDGLAAELARGEREHIEKALEMASIEDIRARLAVLEAGAGPQGSESVPKPKTRSL